MTTETRIDLGAIAAEVMRQEPFDRSMELNAYADAIAFMTVGIAAAVDFRQRCFQQDVASAQREGSDVFADVLYGMATAIEQWGPDWDERFRQEAEPE